MAHGREPRHGRGGRGGIAGHGAIELAALAATVGMDPWPVLTAPSGDLFVIRALVTRALRIQDERDRALAQNIANFVWRGVRVK